MAPGEGQRLMAVFLNLVRAVDAALAANLHDSKGVKPFTISYLFGEMPPGGKEKPVLDPEKEYVLRITTYDPILSMVWKEGVLPSIAGSTVCIGQETLVVCGYTLQEELLSDIYCRHIIDSQKPPNSIILRFHTPTAFRSGQSNFLFPLPRFVWLSLNRAWTSVAPVDLGRDLHLWAEKEVRAARYDLKTNILHFDRYRQIGFTGLCEYHINTRDVDRLRSYRLLADFSRYCGLGIKTTMGMGQTAFLQ